MAFDNLNAAKDYPKHFSGDAKTWPVTVIDSILDSVASEIVKEIKKAYPNVHINQVAKSGTTILNFSGYNETDANWKTFLDYLARKYNIRNNEYSKSYMLIFNNTKDSVKAKDGTTPKRAAEYLWTWEQADPMSSFPTTRKELDKFYKDLRAEVEKMLKTGYEQNLKRVKDSISDEVPEDVDLDFLISDEIEAIDGYKKMIAKTDNPKLLSVLSHILDEETEHVEELRAAQSGVYKIDDSVKDADVAESISMEIDETDDEDYLDDIEERVKDAYDDKLIDRSDYNYLLKQIKQRKKELHDSVKDAGYNKYAHENDIDFLHEAINEMRRYERNWSSMTQRQRQNIHFDGLKGLREDIKNAENRLKELTTKR